MEEADFQALLSGYVEYKRRVTDEADIESIKADFDYDDIEANVTYNEILPYGELIKITVDEVEYIVFDQYCLLPKCSCSDASLILMTIDEDGNPISESCFIRVDYKKKRWTTPEGEPANISLSSIRTKLEANYPDFYKKLQQRHLKLKAIYAHCKKRDLPPLKSPELPKVGRNDPCPCGSGKKYKKCCMLK